MLKHTTLTRYSYIGMLVHTCIYVAKVAFKSAWHMCAKLDILQQVRFLQQKSKHANKKSDGY